MIGEPGAEQYVPYRQQGNAHRRVVNVEFCLGEFRYTYPMLIDTDADNIVLPRFCLVFLGLDTADCVATSATTFLGLAEGL